MHAKMIEQAKIFILNAEIRAKVNRTGQKMFGYYIDMSKDYGVKRVTNKLKKEVTSTFSALGFKNIQFIKGAGVSLTVDATELAVITGIS